MRRLIWGLACLVLYPALGFGQSSGEHKGHGYVFAAPGATSEGTGTLHFGGGGEGLVYKGLGVGAELGYVAPWRGFGDGLGTFSANGSYHFRPRNSESRVVPFVTSGYTLLFRNGTAHAFNFGGGLNYWFRDRVGLRFEFRDHVWPGNHTVHILGFRVGMTFR